MKLSTAYSNHRHWIQLDSQIPLAAEPQCWLLDSQFISACAFPSCALCAADVNLQVVSLTCE